MIRKSISAFVLLILFILVLGSLGTANALGSGPACPLVDPALMRDKSFLRSLPPECAKAYQKSTQKANIQNVMPMAVGGPDAFGYTYNDAASYSWVAASTNTGISGDDLTSGAINIGFNFPFYGINYSQLYFNTNGGITFGSGSNEWGGFGIPVTDTPNNLIAPFWEDLVVGSPDNSGAIFYSQGGTAPNRFFILEWRAVTTWNGSSPFSFEAILYENGDIVTQIQSLPAEYYSTVGIENSVGNEGLQYHSGSSGLSAPKAIRFYYPATPAARVLISPLEAGRFSAIGGTSDFILTLANTGNMGTDTYDLTASSLWAVTLYAANGITLLTDTDSDGTVDTGSIPQGSSVTITAKVAAPIGAIVGNANTATITAVSSLNISKSKTANLQSAIPAPFAQIYKDGVDGAMSIELVQPNTQVVKKVTPDEYSGGSIAVTAAPNGNFVYVWGNNGRCLDSLCDIYVREIEYTLLDHSGNTIRAVSKLTDNSGATMYTTDSWPSVAVAPNGIIGVTWIHFLFNGSDWNNNVYFATLDSSGNLITGPTSITNNLVWGTWALGTPAYFEPVLAASDDNRFIIGWREEKNVGDNIWYAARDTAGTSVSPPIALTSDNSSHSPVLNSLTGGKAILTWFSNVTPTYGTPTYAVLNSNGTVSKVATTLGVSYVYETPDAVQLPNGKVAVVWPTDTGIQYSILNSSYILESGPNSASSPSMAYGYGLSVTTDPSSRVIMTWQDGSSQKLFYALGDSAGAFISPPMLYKTSVIYIYTSYGLGNAPLTATNVLSIVRASVNPTNVTSVNFTITFSQSVTGVDVGDFSLTTSGVSDAAVSGLSGSGSVYTATVNTGSGDGTIRLNVDDDNSIVDAASNPLGGAASGDGNFTIGQVYTINKSSTFADVPLSYWSHSYIERLYNASITGGCMTVPLNYCPTTQVTRAQMAIFLLRGIHGSAYTPPAATGTKFADVPLGTFGAAWIEQLATEGITSGCGGGNYCPTTPVSRAQMAIFLVRAKHGSTFVPPAATGIFADVPIGSFGANFIEQLVTDAITSGCGNGNYCPNTMVKRDSMAVFLVKTFGLP